tara:strand:+ start:87 stop:239 length:153 start_codon:yes stop_codon:yes gene_type:complete
MSNKHGINWSPRKAPRLTNREKRIRRQRIISALLGAVLLIGCGLLFYYTR